MGRQFTLTPAGKPIIPDKVSWLNSRVPPSFRTADPYRIFTGKDGIT